MKETRRLTIERDAADERRRLVLEQTMDEMAGDTPAWDRFLGGLKEGFAEKGALFFRSFAGALVPSIAVAAVVLVLFIIYLTGGK